MKRSTGDYETATFIVRLWREPHDVPDVESGWRGTAVHVQSGTERGIQELGALLQFMETWMETESRDRDK